jgi:hypothetical protein
MFSLRKILLTIAFLLCAVPAWATQPSYDGSNHVEGDWGAGTAHTDFSVVLPNATALHKYIIVNWFGCSGFFECTIDANANVYIDSVTDDQSNTYYPCGNNFTSGGVRAGHDHFGRFAARITTAGTTTITEHVHIGSNMFGGVMMAYEVDLGISDADPCDTSTINNTYVSAASTSSVVTSSTLTASNEWLDCTVYAGAAPTFSSPFTQLQGDDNSYPYMRTGYAVASTSGVQTCTITYSGTVGTDYNFAAFKSAAAPSGSTAGQMMLIGVGK